MLGAEYRLSVIDKQSFAMRPLIWLEGQQFCTEHETADNLHQTPIPLVKRRSGGIDACNLILLSALLALASILPLDYFFPEWLVSIHHPVDLVSSWLYSGLLSEYFSIVGWSCLVVTIMSSRGDVLRPMTDIIAVGYCLFAAFRWVDNWIVLEMVDLAIYQDLFRLACIMLIYVLYYVMRQRYSTLSTALMLFLPISWGLYVVCYGILYLILYFATADGLELGFVWGYGESFWGYLWTVLFFLILLVNSGKVIPMTSDKFIVPLNDLCQRIKNSDRKEFVNSGEDLKILIDSLLQSIRFSDDPTIYALQNYKTKFERLKSVIESVCTNADISEFELSTNQLRLDMHTLARDLQQVVGKVQCPNCPCQTLSVHI